MNTTTYRGIRMHVARGVVALLPLLLAPLPVHAQWADDGGDHGGADWVLEDGAVLSGLHTNIGRLVVPEGVTVRVLARDGEAGGMLEIHACELELLGTIDADGAGHPGAPRAANNGGRQGAGPAGGCGGGAGSCVGQGATGGSYGGVGGTAETNTNWARNNQCNLCDNPARNQAHCYGAAGEAQGTDDGDDLAPGSGGGSGGNSCNCNNAGGLGAAGGGAVKLLINEEALIDGVITANGGDAEPDDSNCGYHPGGGGGSGGGILVQAEELSGSGALSAAGGEGGETDGCPASCGNWAWAGGGGGGGRIKTFSLNDTFDGDIAVGGGEGGGAPGGNYAYAGLPGGDGTVHRGEELVVDLIPCEGPPRMRINHDLTFGEAQEFTLTLDARDPDGGDAHYHWDLDDDGEFDDESGLEITHEYPDDGTYPVAVRGTDDEGDVAVYEFEVQIANRPPVIQSDPPADALEDDEYVYAIDAVDPAGRHDPLEVELVQSPVGMEVDDLLITWTPTIFQALEGQFVIAIRVTDDDGGAVSQSWPLTVRWLDGDGMSDGWEREFGLDPNDPSDADEDPDGDGLSNLQEFRERRDPTRSGIPDVPEPLTPDDGAWVGSSTPELTIANAFDPDNDVLTYSFEVAEDAEFRREHFAEQGISEGEGGRTTWQVRLPLREGLTYFWRVRASDGPFHSDYSEPRSFTVNSFPEPPNLPELQSPRDGGPVATPTPELTVGAVHDPDGDPVEIHFEVFLDEAGLDLAQSFVVPQERGDAVVIGVPDPPLAEDTDYWWRAEAVDSAELSSGFTDLWSFRVNSDNGAPPAPELLRPSDGAQIAEFTVLLAMRAGEDPDGDRVVHRVEVDRTPDFDSPLLEVFSDLSPAMGDVVTVELDGRQDNTLYHWRARAEDGLDSSEWVTRRFVVNFDNEAPGPPTALSPAGGERVSPDGLILTAAPARDPDHDPLRYVFQVATDVGFAAVVAESDPVPGGEENEGVAWLIEGLDAGAHFWRVHAVDPQRLRSDWSDAARFVVDESVAGPGDVGGPDGGGDDDGVDGGGDDGGGGLGGGEGGGEGGGDDGIVPGGEDAGAFGGKRSAAGGCNCRAAGGSTSSDGALLLLLGGLLALRRK